MPQPVKIIPFVLIAILITAGCGEPIPIKEMTAAKKGITKATSVKADSYAPEELVKAKEKLYESHDFTVKEDLENAKKSAEESSRFSQSAYEKSIPLLARDTREIAEKSLEGAREVYAEQLAPDEYKKADDELKKSDTLFENKEYYEAYLSAVEADRYSKNARSVSIGKKDLLRDAIAEVKITLENSEKYSVEKYSAAKYRLAKENVTVSEKFYTDLKLKQGFSAVEVAKINADEAYLEALEGSARERAEKASAVIARAKKSIGTGAKAGELDGASEAHENAMSLLKESQYRESITFSDEAIRLAAIAVDSAKRAVTAGDSSVKGGYTTGDTGEKVEYDYYRVKYRKGRKDCLWRIAQKYYSNPMLWKKIYHANRKKIKNPDLIRPGWVLRIPRLKK